MDNLTLLRERINTIDNQIIELLGNRFSICLMVAEYKKSQQIPMMQENRIEEVKSKCKRLGNEFNVDENFINDLYTLIINEACRLELQLMDK